jgi:hypothetical protein
MYLGIADGPTGLMVARQIGGGSGAEDGRRMAAAVYDLARAPVWPGRPKVYLLYIERDSPHPGPLEREEIAEAWRRVDGSRTIFAAVSDSPIVRATFEVVSTLRRQPGYSLGQVFATSAEAFAWIEASGRPGVTDKLVALDQRVQEGLRNADSWGGMRAAAAISVALTALRRS